MIVNHQGKPYSKRDGDAYVGDFRAAGYLPEALFNYLALLGWSPGDDRELMTRDEMVEAFTLDRVQSSPAMMDPRKLLWMNGEYMTRLPTETYREQLGRILREDGVLSDETDEAYFQRVAELMGDRIKRWSDAAPMTSFFFADEFPFDEKAVRKRLRKEGALDALRVLRGRYENVQPFEAAALEAALEEAAGELGLGKGGLIHPARVAVSGLAIGPGLFEMLEVLGRERVLTRFDRALERFGAEEE
jgi:glutamyl-tRNA synthetase